MTISSIKTGLIVLLVSLLVTTPFYNQAITTLLKFNLSKILLVLPIFYFFIKSIEIGYFKTTISINSLLVLLIFLVPILLISVLNIYINRDFLVVIAAFLFSIVVILEKNNIKQVQNKIIIGVLISSLIGICLSVFDFSNLIQNFISQTRSSYYSGSISIAILCGTASISVLYLKMNKLFKICMILFLLLIAIFTLSRGPILALFIIFILHFISRKNYFSLLAIFALFFASSVLMIFYRDSFFGDSGRFALIELALNLINNQFIGYGLGGYEFLVKISKYPHNLLLESLINFGLLFTLVYLIMLSIIASRYFYTKNSDKFWLDIFLYLNIICLFSLSFTDIFRVLLPLVFLTLFTAYDKRQTRF